MGDIYYKALQTDEEIAQLLALQARNVYEALDRQSQQSQGFLSVTHTPALLRAMNADCPQIIAKSGDLLCGYCLVMSRQFDRALPDLIPFFETLYTLSWRGTPLASEARRWFVMGQVCVHEAFRGQGVFDGLYTALRERYHEAFDFTVTEVADLNKRSMRAHERVGFQPLHRYTDDAFGRDWTVIVWEFN
ncbi:MAG: GNAT family N-acetyltransferase [Saprospiraceae bacterium]